MTGKLSFIAQRSDGLGERFRAIINALALSEKYGASFYFTWPKISLDATDHSIVSVERIFSENFIEKHYISEDSFKSSKIVDEFFLTNESGVYHCNQQMPHQFVTTFSGGSICYSDWMKNAFNMISFSDHLEEAFIESDRILLEGDCVALHLRAGDLVYGTFRQNLSYIVKAIPYPLADKIIEHASINKMKTIVFGQDKTVLEYFSRHSNFLSSADYMPKHFDTIQAAFFDFLLMSKCKSIYSGSSGFAILSKIVGIAKTKNCSDFLTEKEQIDAIVESVEASSSVPNLQRSFACKSALVNGFDSIDDDVLYRLIDIGKKNDPNSVVFDFFYIWKEYMSGREQNADRVLGLLRREKTELFSDFLKYNFSSSYQASFMKNLFAPEIIENYTALPETKWLHDLIKHRVVAT